MALTCSFAKWFWICIRPKFIIKPLLFVVLSNIRVTHRSVTIKYAVVFWNRCNYTNQSHKNGGWGGTGLGRRPSRSIVGTHRLPGFPMVSISKQLNFFENTLMSPMNYGFDGHNYGVNKSAKTQDNDRSLQPFETFRSLLTVKVVAKSVKTVFKLHARLMTFITTLKPYRQDVL